MLIAEKQLRRAVRNAWAAERRVSGEVYALSKRRITFYKTGMGKYISHLDLLRCFTRTIQRSGLPVVYSQGFNPHQKITFSLPLPIGVTGICETVDIQFEDNVTDEEIKEKMNKNLPPDIGVVSVDDIVYKAAEIAAAEYVMSAAADELVSEDKIKAFFAEPEIAVAKKSKKKGEKIINLPDYIKSWEITNQSENGFELKVILDAGGERNLKPELLAAEIEKYILPVKIDDWQIQREKIFRKGSNGILEIFK